MRIPEMSDRVVVGSGDDVVVASGCQWTGAFHGQQISSAIGCTIGGCWGQILGQIERVSVLKVTRRTPVQS